MNSVLSTRDPLHLVVPRCSLSINRTGTVFRPKKLRRQPLAKSFSVPSITMECLTSPFRFRSGRFIGFRTNHDIDEACIQSIEHRPKSTTLEAESVPVIDLSDLNSDRHGDEIAARRRVRGMGVLSSDQPRRAAGSSREDRASVEAFLRAAGGGEGKSGERRSESDGFL